MERTLSHDAARRFYDGFGRLQDLQAFYESPAVVDSFGSSKGKSCYAYWRGGGEHCTDCACLGALEAEREVEIEQRCDDGGRALVRAIPAKLPDGETGVLEVVVTGSDRSGRAVFHGRTSS